MRKFRNIKGTELAESYKKGWELAIMSLEKLSNPYILLGIENEKITEPRVIIPQLLQKVN